MDNGEKDPTSEAHARELQRIEQMINWMREGHAREVQLIEQAHAREINRVRDELRRCQNALTALLGLPQANAPYEPQVLIADALQAQAVAADVASMNTGIFSGGEAP